MAATETQQVTMETKAIVDTQPIYTARPVGYKQIRTLTLHSGSGSDPIVCCLDVVPLENAPLFSALSYTWGPAGDEREIQLDHKTVPVRENLWQALQHLRFPSTNRILWVDALCINQNVNDVAIKERNEQVAMMYTIYGAAYQVLVWLGKEPVDGLGYPTIQTEKKEAPDFVPIDPTKDWDGFTAAIDTRMKLYDREYFSRIWIIQEIMYAQRILFHFGTQQISWREFSAPWNNSREDENARIAAATSLIVLKNQHTDDEGNPPNMSLSEWLHHFKASQCQDPRDKVYAFLGLISPKSRSMIKVDYSKLTEIALSDLFWQVRRAEQYAHPKENRFLLDYAFSRAMNLNYLLKPPMGVRLTSRGLKLPFMPVYSRSGPTRSQNTDRLLGFGRDFDEEKEVLEGMNTYYRTKAAQAKRQ